MEIAREIMADLVKWKERNDRKPLILQGARQIGKTWLMKEFGQKYYKHTAYFNFERSDELKREFSVTKDPERLLGTLRLYTESPIDPEDTLIIFDEIQECNDALNSLKYFCEEVPQYHIIAAGSLLGVSLSKGDSFPVGKVDFLDMYPVTFKEFLRHDNPRIYEYIDGISGTIPLPEIVMNKASESYSRYLVCGGMPASASSMLDGNGMESIGNILDGILNSYSLDFSRHAPGSVIPRIEEVWRSVPAQLAKENRKFIYKLVKDGARAREYEGALLWLEQARLVYKIHCASKPGLPLSAYDDPSAFKIYLCDIGLLRNLAKLPADIVLGRSPLYSEFRGAVAENAVLQSLMANFKVTPRYWTSSGTAEVDFLLQNDASIIPVEVKSGSNLGGRSLRVYIDKYKPEIALRYSMNNLKKDGGILNIPLFLADWTKKLLQFS